MTIKSNFKLHIKDEPQSLGKNKCSKETKVINQTIQLKDKSVVSGLKIMKQTDDNLFI